MWTYHLALRNLAAARVRRGVQWESVSPWSEEGVCVIEVWWQAICSRGEEWGRGWQHLAAHTSSHSHTGSRSQGSDALQIQTSLLCCLICSAELGFSFPSLWKWFLTSPWLRHCSNTSWDLDLFKGYVHWARCCRLVARACNVGLNEGLHRQMIFSEVRKTEELELQTASISKLSSGLKMHLSERRSFLDSSACNISVYPVSVCRWSHYSCVKSPAHPLTLIWP